MKKTAVAVLVWGVGASAMFFHALAQTAPDAGPGAGEAVQAQQDFNGTCAVCHGDNAKGGDRAPSLIDNPDLRKLDVADIAGIIKGGTSRGMPSFSTLPDTEISLLARWLHSKNQSGLTISPPEQVAAG